MNIRIKRPLAGKRSVAKLKRVEKGSLRIEGGRSFNDGPGQCYWFLKGSAIVCQANKRTRGIGKPVGTVGFSYLDAKTGEEMVGTVVAK